jgi:hypothetical protein
MALLIGSICLTDIPRELIKNVVCKDGVTRKYLNISVVEMKEKSQFGDTHFISCAPKKDERKDGVKYIIGNLKTYEAQAAQPTPAEIDKAPVAADDDDSLPF